VYILPVHAASAPAFRAIDAAIGQAGAPSYLLEVQASDEQQAAAFAALFDRSQEHAQFALALKEARRDLKSAAPAGARRVLRSLEQQLQTLLASDFFPGKAAASARAGLQALRQEVQRRLSPGEPSVQSAPLSLLATGDFQGRTWATRSRPWVDRLASAWLIQRFIDASPTFIWLADAQSCPDTALGFDFDGARFTHLDQRVTFEVLSASFGLAEQPALQRLGALVHCIDVGGIAVDEAAGLELLVHGLQAMHTDDDALLAAALPLFDALYRALELDLQAEP
jgi:hypothetical protein